MAKKKPTTRPAGAATCRDCAHAYGHCGRDYDGRLMLCRCPHDTRRRYKPLTDPTCNRFKPKDGENRQG